jgi:hypothetical protein
MAAFAGLALALLSTRHDRRGADLARRFPPKLAAPGPLSPKEAAPGPFSPRLAAQGPTALPKEARTVRRAPAPQSYPGDGEGHRRMRYAWQRGRLYRRHRRLYALNTARHHLRSHRWRAALGSVLLALDRASLPHTSLSLHPEVAYSLDGEAPTLSAPSLQYVLPTIGVTSTTIQTNFVIDQVSEAEPTDAQNTEENVW